VQSSAELTLAMSAQAFLWTLCCSTSALSSSSVQAPFWMSGRSSWFQRSRSCFPIRPLKYGTSFDHEPSPYVSTSLQVQCSTEAGHVLSMFLLHNVYMKSLHALSMSPGYIFHNPADIPEERA